MIQINNLSLLGVEEGAKGTTHTSKEIAGQPTLWEEVFNQILQQKAELEFFLLPVLALKDLRIILAGAGSSAFIGESVQGIVQKETQRVTQAIATTDLITHASSYFLKEVPTLLISFARSGNSPESLEAINLANLYCDRVFHLIITCNEKGAVIKNIDRGNSFVFILPKAANDKGLAMTGSFTSMLLSIILIIKLSKIDSLKKELREIEANAIQLIQEYSPLIKKVTEKKFERVIFLGSGPMLGIARECHLKLQELTDGRVICKHDSFLGFRHGPRVVINDRSLIVYLFSNKDYVFQYEKDLADSIAGDSIYFPAICFGRKIDGLKNGILDIVFKKSIFELDVFYYLSAALIGQLLGFYKSIELGLEPDNPSVSGAINRVVQGVTIYSTETILE